MIRESQMDVANTMTDKNKQVNHNNKRQRRQRHGNLNALLEAQQASVKAGLERVCRNALCNAIKDKRLCRLDLCVLSNVVNMLADHHAAVICRSTLSILCGSSVSTISNSLSRLRAYEYLMTAEIAGTRRQGAALGATSLKPCPIDGLLIDAIEQLSRDLQSQQAPYGATSQQCSSPPAVNSDNAWVVRSSLNAVNYAASSPNTVNPKPSSPHTVNINGCSSPNTMNMPADFTVCGELGQVNMRQQHTIDFNSEAGTRAGALARSLFEDSKESNIRDSSNINIPQFFKKNCQSGNQQQQLDFLNLQVAIVDNKKSRVVVDEQSVKPKRKRATRKTIRNPLDMPHHLQDSFEKFWKAFPHYITSGNNNRSSKAQSRIVFWELCIGEYICKSKPRAGSEEKAVEWHPGKLEPDYLINCANNIAAWIGDHPDKASMTPASERWLKQGLFEKAEKLTRSQELLERERLRRELAEAQDRCRRQSESRWQSIS